MVLLRGPGGVAVLEYLGWTCDDQKSALLIIPIVIAGILFLIALFGIFSGEGLISVITFILALVFAAPSALYATKKFNEASAEHTENVVEPMVARLIEEPRVSSVTGQQSALDATYDPKGSIPLGMIITPEDEEHMTR
ncbi:hypothetical protein [Glutamicibacter nicotianae]|uniref:hypothetical protein n=1 Tax=Glutamicibacter nicotianae TaxID=37929 RepID=UPI0011449CF5|nr:hypothetical protein [Glutamicibacter nicotianae]